MWRQLRGSGRDPEGVLASLSVYLVLGFLFADVLLDLYLNISPFIFGAIVSDTVSVFLFQRFAVHAWSYC